jgi:lecithin:cholesterol acyltransferase
MFEMASSFIYMEDPATCLGRPPPDGSVWRGTAETRALGAQMGTKNLVIILVPGGMGTTLSLSGTAVWDFNLFPPRLDGVRMITDPALLVPWLPLKPGNLLSVYDDFIAFLVSHGYVKGTDLFLWGYDWRRGMEANAVELANFVKTIILGSKKILFIAHSSGCMVVRWALLFGTAATPGVPMISNALVDSVVAAGPPMLGMARPFKDIVQMPSINDTFDTLFALLRLLYPALADQVSVPINKSLMTVTAQLEALAPNNIPILSGGSSPPSSSYGVFNWKGWPDELGSLLASVQATQGKLQATNWGGIKCTVVASQSHDTDTGYVLDNKDAYKSDLPVGKGDDSVLLSSAQAYCPSGNFVIVGERHRTLLDDPQTRTALAAMI